jgi:hypothetical protein
MIYFWTKFGVMSVLAVFAVVYLVLTYFYRPQFNKLTVTHGRDWIDAELAANRHPLVEGTNVGPNMHIVEKVGPETYRVELER